MSLLRPVLTKFFMLIPLVREGEGLEELHALSSGSAPGIFTQNSSGCGQAAAFNIHADGSTTLNTPQTSFDPQKDAGFAIFLTGLGFFSDRVDGEPWSFNPADNRNTRFGAEVGFVPGVNHLSWPLAVSYAGPAPGLTGVDQVNALYYNPPKTSYPSYPSQSMPEGCRMPLTVQGAAPTSLSSQLANVSVHSGGGACSDTPANSLGVAVIKGHPLAWNQVFQRAACYVFHHQEVHAIMAGDVVQHDYIGMV